MKHTYDTDHKQTIFDYLIMFNLLYQHVAIDLSLLRAYVHYIDFLGTGELCVYRQMTLEAVSTYKLCNLLINN